ncbi:5'-3' exoribonuclease 1 isoform X2 [Bradysia coprophila]|uniref:5'-3' exoribonuclease 1 isoform X2 n=1 Tax=Bradysia coprophila TaxID=38358 RepID=UPI00187DD2BD|nr:5'-3' exoribonuclease 1 isoform X2 [Bradysia coprophila]
MGVPKFFRYISERYPCLSELIRESQIPDFDNLYLDMNGIIHNCSHPDDGNVHFRMTEEQMFLDIFHYIETLFRLIRPQKLFFMAVDGVAPRAKMNQQRGRRFRSAKEAEKMEEDAKKKGETLPDTERFDSNCITPGTAFMVRLQDALRHFVKVKITTNPLWQKCKVILSGHETPGEGEHKIMEYIRFIKSKPGFDPNTRHCLYGLDADLVMLGLCSHELHFSLLREEVKFGSKAKKPTGVDQTRFYLLHLGLLREYLELEFARIKDSVPFGFDIEKIVDDWILMGFFVGNDFIPHLPNLHINENALPILYETYMDVLPTLDGYINEGGKLNLQRLNVFMKALAVKDKELFSNQRSNFKGLKANEANDETFGVNFDSMSLDMDADLMELVKNSNEMFDDDDDTDENDDEMFDKEFEMHKRDYYIKKLKYPEMTPEVLAEQTECYIRALQWTLFYYYRGVKSWGWYYPHHYSPYISDIQNFSDLKLDFEMGKPFLPFEQLLAVLPAASRSHLPSAYHNLMMEENSSVIDFYPKDFDTDMNGKKQEWEAVVLIPFIDEKRLLSAMAECHSSLTDAEVKRNVHGPMLCYEFSTKDSGMLDSKFGLSAVRTLQCIETPIYRDELNVAEANLVLGPSAGSLRDVYFPGFPTMKHLKYTGSRKFARTRVFDQPSRNESMIVQLEPHPPITIQDAAAMLLGKEIFVGWPHLSEGKVISVMDESTTISTNGCQSDKKVFNFKSKTVIDHYMNRMGIDLGDVTILVCVAPLRNREYTYSQHGKMVLNKMWGEPPVFYPIQSIVKDIAVHDPHYVQHKNVVDIFTVGSKVFMADTMYVGSMGIVTDPTPVKDCGRIKLTIEYYTEPDLEPVKRLQEENATNFINSYSASSSIGMHSSVFSLVTGSLIVVRGEKRFPLPDNTPKANIGLQLKFPKKNEEVVGYTKKVGNQFMYSKRAIELVEQYWQRFPDIFMYLGNNPLNDQLFESVLFQGKVRYQTGVMDEVVKWIKEQPYFSASTKRSCGSNGLDEMAMKMVVQMVNVNQKSEYKNIKLQAKPHLLLKPGLNTPNPEANHNFRVLDRVVVVSETFSVPLGYKGTITAVHTITDPNPVRLESVRKTDVLYEVLFDRPFDEGNTVENVAEKRFFNVPPMHLLNITHGLKAHNIIKNAESVQPAMAMDKKNIWEELKRSNENKKNSSNVNAVAVVAPQLKINNVNQQVNSKTTVKQHDESDVLRKLLKIQQTNQTEPTVIPTTVNHENSTKINVSDLFRVDPAHPPKPPLNWHSQKSNRNKVFPQDEVSQPKSNSNFYPPTTTKPNYIHHPRPNSAAHRSPIHNDVNFSLSNQILPPQGPRGPPNLGKYVPGHHGAFIPLQATRSITKSSKEPDNTSKPKAENNNLNISTNQPLVTGQVDSGANATKKSQAQQRQSKMRVAANFNFPSKD